MAKIKALVVGASGLVGSNFTRHLLSLGGWEVTALSRRPPAGIEGVRHVAVDLLDPAQCLAAAQACLDVTHVFFCARAVENNYVINVDPNKEIVVNLLDALLPIAAGFQHIQIVHGMKWYGSNLGPYRTPAEESHPRLPGRNFYYEQLDAIIDRQQGRSWTWSSVRPHFIFGLSVGSPSNPVCTIGAYAAILKELGLPLYFPGPEASFDAKLNVTDVGLLTKAMVWAATTPHCANNAFNIVNGDTFRWRDLWPLLARHFGMETGGVSSMKILEFMSDKQSLWEAVVRRYGLRSAKLEEIADWAFADVLFAGAWDQTASVAKARRFGFGEMVDTEKSLIRALQRYRDLRLLP